MKKSSISLTKPQIKALEIAKHAQDRALLTGGRGWAIGSNRNSISDRWIVGSTAKLLVSKGLLFSHDEVGCHYSITQGGIDALASAQNSNNSSVH